MSDSPTVLRKQLVSFLSEMGRQGTLDSELTDAEIGRLLTSAPVVLPSRDFVQRAMEAMARAQRGREEENPAVALGVAVAQARRRTGLELSAVADRAGASIEAVEALEYGRLSVSQILRVFPPPVVAQLLRTIELAVHEFSGRLMDLVAHGGTGSNRTLPLLVHRQRGARSELSVEDVARYVAIIEDLMKSA